MTFLSWRDDYAVGVRQIDAEHRSLFDLINEFHDTHARGHSRKQIAQVLNRLVVYAETHFQNEERLMGENGYPLLEMHREQHGKLVSSVFAINERLASDVDKASIEILPFIKSWLVGHIVNNDMDIGVFLRRKTDRADGAPQAAPAQKIEETAPAQPAEQSEPS